jgi:hypothetical protein
MKAISQTRASIGAAIQSLQSIAASDEPDEIAAGIATAGDSIASAIGTMEGTFKGFRRDVEVTARRLAARVQS